MKELSKTITFFIIAILSCALAYILAPQEKKDDADQLGQEFFVDFQNPLNAKSLEVFTFNENTGGSEAFKVEFVDGRWIIPSHENYPADAKEKMEVLANAFIGLKREEIRSESAADQASMSLIDPTDQTVGSITGRGSKVIIKGEDGQLLCQYIVGKKVPRKQGYRYLRLPGQAQSYVVSLDTELSTEFRDWVNPAIWTFSDRAIDSIVVKDYSVTEGKIKNKETFSLRQNTQGQWTCKETKKSLKHQDVQKLAKIISQLSFRAITQKPAGVVESLLDKKAIKQDQKTLEALAGKGFYLLPTGLVSDEGEIIISKKNGVVYGIRFGGYDGNITVKDKGDKKGNRYCFITAGYDPKISVEPKMPKTPEKPHHFSSKEMVADYKKKLKALEPQMKYIKFWQEKKDKALAEVEQANRRFASWFYVIDQYQEIRKPLKDLTQ